MITYEQHLAAYEARKAQAIEGMTCFCVCGCNRPVESLGSFGGPATCPDCRGEKGHGLTPRAVETYDWDRSEAIQYAGVDTIDTATAKAIVDGQIKRSKAAPKTLHHVGAAQAIVATQMDLDRVHIGPEVTEGTYAVVTDHGETVGLRIERPTVGAMHGFIVVSHDIEGGWKPCGVQYPDPHVSMNGYVQTYRGAYPYLVSLLVYNPDEARTFFEEAS